MEGKDNVSLINEKRLLDVKELCRYLSLGKNRAVDLGKSIGAERKIGRRCLYDKVVIDRYLDLQMQEAI